MDKPQKIKILVAPLNWGLGHATRCIPIINQLEKQGFEPVIASDGASLNLLKLEFPNLKHYELPSYNIKYSTKDKCLKLKLTMQLPKIFNAIRKEKKVVQNIIKENNIKGIISDNRLGVYSKKTSSVYMTHQVNVLFGSFTLFSSKIHQHYINKFDECWIPDSESDKNLSGRLGHLKKGSKNHIYLGPISRVEFKNLPAKYDIAAILSGPEPQRTLLEEKLLSEFNKTDKSVLLVRGVFEKEQKLEKQNNITVFNFMNSNELETALNESEIIVSRSGYTTIMDLACLQKKAFFIPTPGQEEQEYLAKRLKRNGYAPFSKQDDFSIDKLDELDLYKGLSNFNHNQVDWKKLFCLFQSK